jgi:hypothetical protein
MATKPTDNSVTLALFVLELNAIIRRAVNAGICRAEIKLLINGYLK